MDKATLSISGFFTPEQQEKIFSYREAGIKGENYSKGKRGFKKMPPKDIESVVTDINFRRNLQFLCSDPQLNARNLNFNAESLFNLLEYQGPSVRRTLLATKEFLANLVYQEFLSSKRFSANDLILLAKKDVGLLENLVKKMIERDLKDKSEGKASTLEKLRTLGFNPFKFYSGARIIDRFDILFNHIVNNQEKTRDGSLEFLNDLKYKDRMHHRFFERTADEQESSAAAAASDTLGDSDSDSVDFAALGSGAFEELDIDSVDFAALGEKLRADVTSQKPVINEPLNLPNSWQKNNILQARSSAAWPQFEPARPGI